MNTRSSADRLLRRMHLAGYGAAAAAGAMTVGLIAGVANTTHPTAGTTNNAAGTVVRSDDDGEHDDDAPRTVQSNTGAAPTGQQSTQNANANGAIAPAQQNAAPVGGSNGS